MSTTRLAVDRVEITLVGMPPADADSTARGLEAALVARFAAWRPEAAGGQPMHLGDLDLGTVDLTARLDAATLATLLFERFADRMKDTAAEAGDGV